MFLRKLNFLFIVAAVCVSQSRAVILDRCPGTDVKVLHKLEEQYEVSLTFYYVSWNPEAVQAKDIIEKVSNYYDQQVQFATVNCWHLTCNCNKTNEVSKLMGVGIATPHKWPMLLVRYGRKISIQYRGEWNFSALTSFINALLRPHERVNNENDLETLLIQNDAVVLGLFPKPSHLTYGKFVSSAVIWLESDPERKFRFATAFGTAAETVVKGVNKKLPFIALIHETALEVFDINVKTNVSQIVAWVQSGLKRGIKQSHGYNTPFILTVHMRSGPVLAIFTSDLNTKHNFYTRMSDVVDSSSSLISRYKKCKLFWKHHQYSPNINYKVDDFKNAMNVCHQKNYLNGYNLKDYYIINKHLDYLFTKLNSNGFHEKDIEKSPSYLLVQSMRNECLSHPQQDLSHLRIIISKYLKKYAKKLRYSSSLEHFDNRTLSVVILDGDKYNDFLNANGISATPGSDATVLIIDPKKENIFVMEESYTFDALADFLGRYYNKNNISLIPHRSSSEIESTTPSIAKKRVHLPDLNRETLLNLINQQNITTAVLFYSTECAFSAIMSHTLLQLSSMLSTSKKIQFVRINTQKNDLPWEFVMPSVPTLLVFPHGRFTESRKFPSHLPVTVQNVFGFILAQLDSVEQTKLVVNSCQRPLLPQRLKQCLTFAKSLIMKHIANHLKLWQTNENERSLVLNRLKQFKDITLYIQKNFNIKS